MNSPDIIERLRKDARTLRYSCPKTVPHHVLAKLEHASSEPTQFFLWWRALAIATTLILSTGISYYLVIYDFGQAKETKTANIYSAAVTGSLDAIVAQHEQRLSNEVANIRQDIEQLWRETTHEGI